jgi:hypothetical protein
MSVTCRFCDRQFANAQAVRAHLKSCEPYQTRTRERSAKAGRLGSRASGSGNLGEDESEVTLSSDSLGDSVIQLRQRLATERLRLELRGVEEAHAEIDRRADSAKQQQERRAAELTVQLEAKARGREEERERIKVANAQRERREAINRARQESRRQKIQKVKEEVTSGWVAALYLSAELKSRVLRDIEIEFARLPIEDLPHGELIAIAEGICDPIYRAARQAQENKMQAAARRQRLVQHGHDYAASVLRAVDDLDVIERWRIERAVENDLEAIGANETTDDIEDRVDGLLESEGIGWENVDD